MSETSIEWTDVTWNPVRGCRRVSPGCENCYAEKLAHRFSGPGKPYEGLTRLGPNGVRWTGEARLVPEVLDQPRRWRKPRRVFVNSMSDLFHESLSENDIKLVFAAMASAPQHTFQVLTKRADRMRQVLSGWGGFGFSALPNVWLGVSVEDQQRADERIPHLLATPAAVRFLSCEPLLEGVRLSPSWLLGRFIECRDETNDDEQIDPCQGCDAVPNDGSGGGDYCGAVRGPRIDWVIVGGESGPGARPFGIDWGISLLHQCAAAGVACFVKQLGARPFFVDGGSASHSRNFMMLADKKGGDMAEWPEDLRVREWPEART